MWSTAVTGKEGEGLGARTPARQLQFALHPVLRSRRRRNRLRGAAGVVRHCLVELDQDGIWLTGGIAEFWSLTTDELKEVVRVAIEEARQVKPAALVQVMSSTDTAKQAVELTLHAQELGADICYVLTPYFECSGKPGVWSTCATSPTAPTCRWASSTPIPPGCSSPRGMRRALPRNSGGVRAEERAARRAAQPGRSTSWRPEMVLWEAARRGRNPARHPAPRCARLGRCTSTRSPAQLLFSEWRELLVARRFRARRQVRGRDRLDRHA